MVEIFILGWYANRIGEMARGRGLSAHKYHLMALLLWCLGEVSGMFVGLSLVALDSALALMVVYLCALAGGGFGAGAAYLIARGGKSGYTHAAAD
jgi:hypothetical protein